MAPVHDTTELDFVICRTRARAEWRPHRDAGCLQTAHHAEIMSLAARHRLPTVYPYRYFVEAGGLLSYGNDSSTISNARRPMPIAS